MIKSHILLLLFTTALTTLPTRAAEPEATQLREAVECNPRAGVPNFLSKIEAGKAVKIGYLGGSITAAPGWRVKSLEWFQHSYPDAKFEEINATIGGTGSDLGVFRMHNDVLRHKPDLLFVEFAVNDGGAPPERIHQAMEGIVRQTWRLDPTTDICFVYTVSLPMMDSLREGKMQRSASAMEDVAERYDIPSIHFGVEVAALEARGDLVFKAPKPEDAANAKPIVFSSDGVHPHVETGQIIYTKSIARSWPAIRDASGKPADHKLPEPLRADNWEAAKQVPITPDMLKGDWVKLPGDQGLGKNFAKNLPDLYQAKAAGSALEFSFKGTSASIFDLVGPDGGELSIQIDGGEPKTVKRIDGYCTYHRMAQTGLLNGAEDAIHKVRITLTDKILEKREILFEDNRKDLEKNPEKYAGHTWYAGSILILGDLVNEDSE